MNENKPNSNQDYLDLVRARRESAGVLELEMPSGAVWRYRPINLRQYALAGQLPMHLVQKLDSAKASARELTDKELAELGVAALTITRDVILHNLVWPRVSLEPSPDTIQPTDIDPEDFDFFTRFVMSGGQADADKFRKRPAKG